MMKDERGEAALIEAAVILPLVFVTVISLLIFGMYLCDKTYAEALAEKYAALGAEEVRVPGLSAVLLQRQSAPETVWDEVTVRFLEDGKNPAAWTAETPDFSAAAAAFRKEMEAVSFLSWGHVTCELKYHPSLTGDSVEAEVRKTAAAGGFLSGLFPGYTVKATEDVGKAAALVRDTDLIADISEDVGSRMKKGGSLKEKIKELFSQ